MIEKRDPRKELAYQIEGLARYYSRPIDQQVLSMMVDDLIDLPLDLVLSAFNKYRKNPKNRSFPLPAQIRDIVSPTESPESVGREIAGMIVQAIKQCGYMRADDVERFLGPVGWDTVQHLGGWMYICENHGLNLNPTSFYAQARELATDLAKYSDHNPKHSIEYSKPKLLINPVDGKFKQEESL